MISRSTAAASSVERSRPDATRSSACVTVSLGKEVAKYLLAVRREDRLRVKLHAFGREFPVTQAPDHAAAAGRYLEHVGDVVVDNQRVVARDLDLLRQAGEDR